MPAEVYKLTVQVGLPTTLDWGRTTNVFYFGVNNLAGGDSYETALDLSAKLVSFLGWLDRFRLLFGIANRFVGWRIVRVAPQPGALLDESREMREITGTGVYGYTQRFVSARVEWLTEDGESRKTYSAIGWTGNGAWDLDAMSSFYKLGLSIWARAHTDPFETAAGNQVNSVVLRSNQVFSAITGFHVVESPGRQLHRRIQP